MVMTLNLKSNLLERITLYSDYSGLDCPAEALRLGTDAARSHLGSDKGWPSADEAIRAARTCDNEGTQQAAQLALSEMTGNTKCHFVDVLD
eukprot:1895303-Alexandrium_andersonii.AAC.1